MNTKKTQNYILKGGLIVWTLWVFINYFIHHPSFFYAISRPPYLKTIITLLIITLGTAFYLFNKKSYTLRGWKIYIFLLLILMIIYDSYASAGNLFTGSIVKHQFYFLTNNIFLHLGTLFIFICCYAAGHRILQLFKSVLNIHHRNIIAIAIGIAILTFFIMILAAFGILKTVIFIPIIAALLVWQYKACWSFIKYVLWNPLTTKEASPWTYVLVMILLIFTAFNLVGAIKIFPLGYDGALLYQNITKSLIDSQMLVKGGQAYNWSLFTSIGPLLFKSMAFSLFLSHIMGVLCLWAMFHLGRVFLGRFSSWLAVTIFYTLPALSFHHFVDEKVDLGFLFICISILIFFLKYGKYVKYDFSIRNKTSFWFFILLGLLLGYAMGVKYLGLILIIGVVSMIIYQWGGIMAYLGSMLFIMGLLFLLNINSFGYLNITSNEKYFIAGISIFLSIVILGFYSKTFDWLKGINIAKNIAIIFIVTLVSFMPWAIKNSIETDSISSKNILYGKSTKENFKHSYSFLDKNNIPFTILEKHKLQVLDYLGKDKTTFDMDNKSFLTLYKEMKLNNKKNPSSNLSERKNTGKREEILRYLGYESGLNRYLSLPYDVSMGVNIINKRGINIGFLFLLFLPLLVLSLKRDHIFNLKNSIGILVFSVVLLLSWKATIYSETNQISISEYLHKFNYDSNLSLTSFGNSFYLPVLYLQNLFSELIQPVFLMFSKITFPYTFFILISLCILLAWISKDNWRKFIQPVKLLLIFMLSYGFLWWILGNGITHYALIIWMLSSLLIAYYYENIKLFFNENFNPFMKKWGQIVFSVFIFLNLFVHFSNQANKWNDSKNLFFKPFIVHTSNYFITDENLKNSNIIITKATNFLNKDISTKIYRVGTYMNYHIKNNNMRVIDDSQLNIFNQTDKILENPSDFLTVLQLNGVKYIVFDLKVAAIDQTPEKTLVDKAIRMVKLLNDKKRIRLIMTDNKVKRYDPSTKKQKISYGLVGKTIKPGSIAIFELL